VQNRVQLRAWRPEMHLRSGRFVAERGSGGDIPLGYVDPNNQSKFHYFKVVYNITTDSVDVEQE
jgi:hypothetical protein